MKLKSVLLLTGFVLSFGSAFAQYAEDALRFSLQDHGTTARFRALGSAQTSLGGDMSSLASNPAGLGLFTRNEINFTPDFVNSSVNSVYAQSLLTVSKDKLGFNQLGGVFHIPATRYRRGSDLEQGWLAFNVGVGYNKTKNYNRDVRYGGVNGKSSFADYLADLSDNYLGAGNPASNSNALPDGTLERMAYDNFLTEYNSSGYFPTTQLNSTQEDQTYYSGSQSEVNLAFAGNYNNQLYLGASASFSRLNYGADREFIESGKTRTYTGQPADLAGATYRLSYRSAQATEGSGFSGKIGLIYHANSNVRLGFSLISPTWYAITDHFSEVLDTRYVRANGTAIPAYTNNNEVYDSDYTLRTPYKLNGGISFVFPGIGLLSGDVEYVDYSSIHFSSSDSGTEDNVNRNISRNYQGALNQRLGVELKAGKQLMIRGGANFSGNPYKTADYTSRIFSGGLGYRKNNFYTDFTYANSSTNYSSRPYSISQGYPDYSFTGSGEQAGITDRRHNFYATFGMRF